MNNVVVKKKIHPVSRINSLPILLIWNSEFKLSDGSFDVDSLKKKQITMTIFSFWHFSKHLWNSSIQQYLRFHKTLNLSTGISNFHENLT